VSMKQHVMKFMKCDYFRLQHSVNFIERGKMVGQRMDVRIILRKSSKQRVEGFGLGST